MRKNTFLGAFVLLVPVLNAPQPRIEQFLEVFVLRYSLLPEHWNSIEYGLNLPSESFFIQLQSNHSKFYVQYCFTKIHKMGYR